MAKQNLTNEEYPNLPDAPTTVTVGSYEAESPYHIGAASEEQEYKTLAQIRLMAIAFVKDFSKKVEERLDFGVENLPAVDKIVEDFKSEAPEEIESFVAECGSYVGLVLEIYMRGKGKWHCSWPNYTFSGFRFPFREDADSGGGETIVETNPYAAVTKRVLDVLGKTESHEAEIEKYVLWLIDRVG